MGLKKRNKVSAEFSMSSLTDIIFLLLIFFMLTSNFVKIESNDLPESDSKTVAPSNMVVSVDKSGNYMFNDQPFSSPRRMKSAIRTEIKAMDNQKNATLTIVAKKGVPFSYVSKIMEVAGQLRIRAIIATQPKPS